MTTIPTERDKSSAAEPASTGTDAGRRHADEWRRKTLLEIQFAQSHIAHLAMNLLDAPDAHEAIANCLNRFDASAKRIVAGTNAYGAVATCKGAA
jgi:hypothetical protein